MQRSSAKTETNVLCQRSHLLRGRVQAEDGKQRVLRDPPQALTTMADDGQRQTIGR